VPRRVPASRCRAEPGRPAPAARGSPARPPIAPRAPCPWKRQATLTTTSPHASRPKRFTHQHQRNSATNFCAEIQTFISIFANCPSDCLSPSGPMLARRASNARFEQRPAFTSAAPCPDTAWRCCGVLQANARLEPLQDCIQSAALALGTVRCVRPTGQPACRPLVRVSLGRPDFI